VMSRISRGRAILRRLMGDNPSQLVPLESAKAVVAS